MIHFLLHRPLHSHSKRKRKKRKKLSVSFTSFPSFIFSSLHLTASIEEFQSSFSFLSLTHESKRKGGGILVSYTSFPLPSCVTPTHKKMLKKGNKPHTGRIFSHFSFSISQCTQRRVKGRGKNLLVCVGE